MAKKKGARKKRGSKSASGFLPEKIFSGRMIVIVLCLVILTGAVAGVWYFFLNSEFFAIKEIVVNRDQSYAPWQPEARLKRLYIGRNIFTVDLKQAQALINSEFPQVRKVEVRRNLPEILEIDIVSREPIAVIDTNGGIVIDAEGVVLAVGEKPEDLIKIKGISFFFNVPLAGERVDNKKLDRAIVLVKVLRRKVCGNGDSIQYVDISDRNNVLIGVSGVIVKMGTDDFSGKIEELKRILNDPRIDVKDIKYIDLRFEDAVISPR